MIRQWIGDVALAILLAVPTAALSRPQAALPESSQVAPLVEQAALAGATTAERRFSVQG